MGERKRMKISISNIDEMKGLYSTRSLKIKKKSKTIVETPYRALTHQELNAKSMIPEKIILPSDISIIFRKFYKNDVEKMLWNNQFVERVIKFLEDYRQRMQHSELIFAFLQPYTKILNEIDISKEKYLRISTKIQLEAGLDVISLPWLNFNLKTLREICKSYEKKLPELEIMPVLDIGVDPKELEPIIEYIKELNSTGAINFIGLLYKPVRKALPSYDLLWESLKDTEICIILLDVVRSNVDLRNLSNIHLNEFILGDIISLEVKRPIIKKQSKQRRIQRRSKRKKQIEEKLHIFNKAELNILPLYEINSKMDDWSAYVAQYFDRRYEIENILKNYKEADKSNEKMRILKAISKVHEFLVSSEEINISRKFINDDETKEYVKEKYLLNMALKSLKGQKFL